MYTVSYNAKLVLFVQMRCCYFVYEQYMENSLYSFVQSMLRSCAGKYTVFRLLPGYISLSVFVVTCVGP